MIQTFKVDNVKCNGCANTLKKRLKPKFGDIDVNLDTLPREITLEINDDEIDELMTMLKSIGYPLTSDKLGIIDEATAKAKSFVSCVIGKVDI